MHLFSFISLSMNSMPEKHPRKKAAQRADSTKKPLLENHNGFVQRVSSCGELANYTLFSHPTLPSKRSAPTCCNNTLSAMAAPLCSVLIMVNPLSNSPFYTPTQRHNSKQHVLRYGQPIFGRPGPKTPLQYQWGCLHGRLDSLGSFHSPSL